MKRATTLALKHQPPTSSGKKLQPRMTLQSSSQGAFLLETLREKSVDVMKKSTSIHGLLQKYGVDIGFLCDSLFNDKFFRIGTDCF